MNINYKVIYNSFGQFLSQVKKDAMLFVACAAPILLGLFIKFGVPAVDTLLIGYFNTRVLDKYYLLFDLLLAVMTPAMFAFVSAMVVLGEIDDGITKYMAVTPLGKGGYIASRTVVPSAASFVMTVIVLELFSLTRISAVISAELSVMASIMGFIMSMLVVSLSRNKVEGMAIMKMTGLIMAGILLPFFVSQRVQYMFFMLPSLWIAKFAVEGKYLFVLIFLLVSTCWISALVNRFMKKIF
ncbi:MAG: ABC transporter permease [Sedimentibacter sp.]|uniref:ABC transporter permease n=1 Tax=Sedimentibacter sp. TaxID=1960295 RepID=UPI0031590031